MKVLYRIRTNRLIIGLIILTLCFMSVSSMQIAYAAESGDNQAGNNTFTLDGMYNMYKNNCEKTVLISKEKNKLEYDVLYKLRAGETVTSHVIATIDKQGNQTLDITEGNKHDILTYTSSGTILLDGQEVTVETYETIEHLGKTGMEITPMGGHRIYWSNSAPYGKSSDYSKYVKTVKKDLTYTKPLKDATVGALVSLICVALSLPGLTSVAIGFIATDVIEWFGRNDPAGKVWSLKDATYVHKTKGFNVKSDMSVNKHVFTYYGNTNYTGKIGTGTRFQVFSY